MKRPIREFIFALFIVAAATFVICFARFSNSPKVLAFGKFHQVAHKGSGEAVILQKTNGQKILRLNDFRTAENPYLEILLISAPDALENETVKCSAVLVLGKLLNSKGNQEYLLPENTDVLKYQAVTIWNCKYAVNYTTAPLKRN